jgi:hypothetical protein
MEDQLIRHIGCEKYKEICRSEFINVMNNNCLHDKNSKHCKMYLEFYHDCMKFKKNKSNK